MDQLLQPDPALGVFSTMLIVEGELVEPESHLARLGASVRALYGTGLPARAAALAADTAQELPLGRLRLSCVPRDGEEPALAAVARPIEREMVLPGWAAPLDLRAVAVDGWHGAHKWVDRRLLERLDAEAAPAGALLLDADGRVLETTRANVFAVGSDDVLRTPPADGSILPGATRAQAIAIARAAGVKVREEPLTAGALTAAREVFATGSLRGLEPVRSLDGAAIGARGAVSELIARALRAAWLERAAHPLDAGARSRSGALHLSKPGASD